MGMFFCYGLFAYIYYISAPLYFVGILDILILLICFSFPEPVSVLLVDDGLLHAERISL